MNTEVLQAAISTLPASDAFSGTVNGDVFNLEDYDELWWIYVRGAGATGTAVLTVQECDDTTPSNSTAIAFEYKVLTSAGSSDSWGVWTAATSSGYTLTAGANKAVIVKVRAAQLTDGYPMVRLVSTEGVDGAVTGCVIALGMKPRHARDQMPTMIA